MSTTVHVQNISAQTSEKEVRDFFSFCGKISNISITPESNASDSVKSATVTFEKESAAKTALLLDNTQLGANQVHVAATATLDQLAGGKLSAADEESSDNISQEDKPRSRIVAEYLAHGYTISDKAIERALALDQQHGVSARFTSSLQQFDAKYQATAKAQGIDQKLGVTDKGAAAWSGLNSYFEKALGTPTGQKLRDFYNQGSKQVLDVHNEARHLANLKTGKNDVHSVGNGKTKCSCGGDSSSCPCADGHCACSGCSKHSEKSSSGATAESADMKVVSEEPRKTKCNCGGAEGNCPCPAGQCTCSGCAKAS
ncbi:hypothetical protein E4T42_09607 [Aureobasidium subglaciale]|nr:hypothetical protein E4T38_07834 [Aureobasidium subglaciale]KAI5216626.1 hypothetical protein E4T40_07844 [Aureobasidium subglaciale]KAI5219962.1 hypothetical protein E4T41_07759 [Aureobasidium subglaciale]KAI5235888.1 hypothetical protein E4T42_09607 [Aureobasidium subglaciale]KAI5257810.1 hypothetical protein E4T46_07735 [Aureobasidium subglaciale]